MAASEAEVQEAVDGLIACGLAEPWPGRVLKIAHTVRPTGKMSIQEAALLAELLLRGAQTPREVRTSCRRMYAFPDRGEVEACLEVLLDADPPLVLRLPRAPGAREARVTHLLGGAPEAGRELCEADPGGSPPSRLVRLEAEIATLRAEVAQLRQAFEAFRALF